MLKYYNRTNNKYEIEQVASNKLLNWIYSTKSGSFFLESIMRKKLVSKIYGFYCDTKISKKNIAKFIDEFSIDMNESINSLKDFKCFNDFFTRKLKSEARPFEKSENTLISIGDGRLSAYENIHLEKLVQIKGFTYSLSELINDNTIAAKYEDGTCLILRLCPTDYHRFHFIDNGTCGETKKINGYYYSVNPIALAKIDKLFCQNKREWSIFHSDNFGDIIYMEVGATCVGSILQTYTPNTKIKKGDEKGYFKFGGSTVLLFFERKKISIDKAIIDQTSKGFETKVLMGEAIGKRQ
jgi:phosphatidylserine decarboxylase